MVEKAPHGETVISVKGLCKSFGDRQVLKNVDLQVGRSEVVCIIGPSGSGKSTVLRSIAFLEQYDGGEVLIEDQLIGYARTQKGLKPVGFKALAKSRRKMGFVFQQFNLWPHKTALSNVAMPLVLTQGMDRWAAQAKAEAMLEKVGMQAFGAAYPTQLSGGQQQRVAIARALAADPRLMLFDEPTSALDPELVGEVLQVMRTLASEGMTMLIVTHEMGFAAQVADRVVFMDHGQVLATGTPTEIFRESKHPRLKQFLKTIMERNTIWAG